MDISTGERIDGTLRRQGCDRHRRGTRDRPLRVAAARERGREGRGERPRRLGCRRGRRPAPRRSRSSTRSRPPAATAVANYDDCASWAGGEAMVQQAIDTFGGLDVLICNAGILRDKMSFNMSEEEFDAVIRVHLKGHFAPIRFAAAYWRTKAKETGEPANAAIVTTASESGSVRQRGPDQLRRRQGRHRQHDHRVGPRARALGRAGQLDRTGCGDAPARHRRDARAHRQPDDVARQPGGRARSGWRRRWPTASPARC